MNDKQPCPSENELADLLEGKLVEPDLSELSEHLEHCTDCQQKVGPLSSQSTLATALRSESNAIDTIAGQTPQPLVDRLKLIPMLAPDHSVASVSDSYSSTQPTSTFSLESITFSADPVPGSLGRIGSYRIMELLGAGGMGSVFRAEDTKLHRNVALKLMLPKIAADPVARQRFLREARAAASLRSDHIVNVYQVDEEKEIPYLAMELLEGRSLDDAIRSAEQLDIDLIVHVALGVAKGLSDAHEKGLVHRDIKPANIWLEQTAEGPSRVKILDFGLARTQVDDTHLTHASAIVGTPAFMAPEQARREKLADERSDLFSLGCVIYYMCTSEVPFKSDSTLGTLMALAVNTPDSPSQRNPAIPLSLSRLTMQLLEKDPSKRVQTARELMARLKVVQFEVDAGTAEYASSSSAPKVSIANTKHYSGRRWLIVGLSSLILICSIGYAYLQSNRKDLNAEAIASDQINELVHSNPANRTANEQLKKVFAQFKLDNPKFEGAFRPTLEEGTLTELTIKGEGVANIEAIRDLKSLKTLIIEADGTFELRMLDLSPIQGFALTQLRLRDGYAVSNVKALQGMPLRELALDYSPISDLTPLEGMPLRLIYLWGWSGSDLTPLRGMPLEELNVGGNGKPMDLSPIKGAPLQFLCINLSQVSDISPLKGAPLRRLYLNQTNVSDLSPVQDAALEEILVEHTRVKDISYAKSWPLKWIEFDYEIDGWYDVLKGISSLERIKDQPAAKVLADYSPEQWLVKEPAFVNGIGMEFAMVPKGKTIRGKGNFESIAARRKSRSKMTFILVVTK